MLVFFMTLIIRISDFSDCVNRASGRELIVGVMMKLIAPFMLAGQIVLQRRGRESEGKDCENPKGAPPDSEFASTLQRARMRTSALRRRPTKHFGKQHVGLGSG